MVKSVPKVAIRGRGEMPVTQVEIERACGHREVLEVRGDPTRSTYLDNARMRDCGRCYREKQTRADAEAVDAGKRCELEGSEKQVAWASGIRQRRAVEFGRMLNDATAWAKEEMARSQWLTTDIAKARTRTIQAGLNDLFRGKVTWVLLNQDGDETEIGSDMARFWIDTRELDVRDFVAALLPQFAWEAHKEWQPFFRPEVVDEEDADDDVEADEPAPAPEPPKPAPKAAAKPVAKAKADLFDDDDVPF